MTAENIVTSSVTLVAARNFGANVATPAILGYSDRIGPDRWRSYSSLSGVGDDYEDTDPEYLCAAQMFRQSGGVESLLILRGTRSPTAQWDLIVNTVANSTAYTVRVGTEEATYTSDGSATRAEIVAGLVAALEALDVATSFAAASEGSGADERVRITHGTAGGWLDVEVLTPSRLGIALTHADPGVADDLDEIIDEGASFRYLLTLYNSQLYVGAVADWCEAARVLYVADVQQSNIVEVAYASADNAAKDNREEERAFASIVYHHYASDFLAAATVAVKATEQPGAQRYAFSELTGIHYRAHTTTQQDRLSASRAGYWTLYGVDAYGLSRTWQIGAGPYLEARGVDVVQAAIDQRVSDHVRIRVPPLNDSGIASTRSVILAELNRWVAATFLLSGSVRVSHPTLASLTTEERNARRVPFTWEASLTGFVHGVTVTGTVQAG